MKNPKQKNEFDLDTDESFLNKVNPDKKQEIQSDEAKPKSKLATVKSNLL